ncbi:MAG: copper-containing nitrite reductase [Mariprofundaceae bacterium]|nr:copper-containing nitrite reductase [Mariprofundaceae bacterium]
MKYLKLVITGVALAIAFMPVTSGTVEASGMKRVKQELVAPPFVPAHDQVAKGGPKIVEVHMSIKEVEKQLDANTWVQAMTFNGTNPGPAIVVHQNDYVELTLSNPKSNIMEHNIDLHEVTGALGGAGLTHVQPGESATIRFKATKIGTFVYHCAPGGAMIPYHVVMGMNGVIVVLPRDGLKDGNGKSLSYDKVWYFGEQDWYIPQDEDGNYKRYDDPMDAMSDTQEVMVGLVPTHVSIGDKSFAYTGDRALKAKVGETVLMIHSQANRDSRPHLIGGHGEYVWERGNFHNPPAQDLETWFIAGGSAGAALYTFKQPGLYVYLSHNLIEAIMKGCASHVMVEGKWNDDLLTQVSGPKAKKGH